MGISGLLKSISSLKKKKHISEYSGKTIAIDAYVWLHKAVYNFQDEFITDKDTSKFVSYFLKKISLLTSYKIKPILIFDGSKLPNKEEIEKKREILREDNFRKYEELKEIGLDEEAKKKFINSIDVTPKMAYKVIKEIKRINVEFFVSPYEADAQITYLYKIGYIFGAISEDSDLLAYGCERVFYKMDSQGYGYEIVLTDLPRCKELDFKLFSSDMFLNTCILAGCDYLESINGIAFKKAHKLMSEFKEVSAVLNYLRKNKFEVPEDYEKRFEAAFLTFKFQTIYCPLKKVFKPFNDIIPDTLYTRIHSYKDRDFLGKIIEDKKTVNDIAFGIIDPTTHEPFEEKKDLSNRRIKNIFSSNEKKNVKLSEKKNNNQLKIENFTKNILYNNSKRLASQVESLSKNKLKIEKLNQKSPFIFPCKSNLEIINFQYIEVDNNTIKEEGSNQLKEKKTKAILNPFMEKFLQLPKKSMDKEPKREISPIKQIIIDNVIGESNIRVVEKPEHIKKIINTNKPKTKLIKKVENISSKFLKLDAMFKPSLFN